MANDESRHEEHGPSRSSGSGPGSPGARALTTSDPAVESAVEHPADRRLHPDATSRVETTQVGDPSPLYVAGVRRVPADDPHARGDGGRPRTEGREPGSSSGRDDRDDRQDQARSQPSMMKILMLTAGVALVCGVVGAMGYSYFFGSDSDKSSGESQGQGQSGSKGGSGSKSDSGSKSGSGSKSDSGSKSGSGAQPGSFSHNNNPVQTNSTSHDAFGSKGGSKSVESGDNSISGIISHRMRPKAGSSSGESSGQEDSNDLGPRVLEVMKRIDRLDHRVDGVARMKDEITPVLTAIQVELGDLSRRVKDPSSETERVRGVEQRLGALQEELKALRARVEAKHGGDAPPTGPVAASGVPGDDRSSGPPTLERGIRLLELGDYARARLEFQRLRADRQEDARIWYFSALAEGLTGGDWEGAARRLADRGLECERSGHPSSAEIDAALATRVPIKGEEWIGSLRRRVIGDGRAAR